MRSVPTLFFKALTVGLLTMLAPSVWAQEAGDTTTIACPAPLPLKLCVDLDGRPSVDPGASPLTYRWLMGDGTTLEGPLITHCYTKRDVYSVQLDVLVNATGELRHNEKRLIIDLRRQDIVNFTAPERAKVGQPVSFAAPDSQLPDCENLTMLWDFRDGLVAQGRQVQHSFRRPGRYQVRFSIRANGPGSCPDSHCVTREIVVEP